MASLTALVSVLALGTAAVAGTKFVPHFSERASDGKTYTQAAFSARPTLLIFLKQDCPSVPFGVKVINQLAADLKGRVQVFGIIDTDNAGAVKQNREWKFTFPLLPDPKRKLIDAFGAEAAFDFSVIGNRGEPQWKELYPGMSAATVNEALGSLRQQGHSIPTVRFRPPQGERLFGCTF